MITILQLENWIENNQIEEIEKAIIKVPKLLYQSTSYNINPLRLACYFQKNEIAEIIAKNMDELTIFDACTIGNFSEVTFKIAQNKQLVNEYSEDGFTPLALACHFGHEEIVRFLILKGANINLPSQNGFFVYPLHDAVACDYLAITQTLLENGATVNVAQKSGLSPLHSAAQNGNIELIILLLEHGADVNSRMEGGKKPTDLAADRGFREIAEILS